MAATTFRGIRVNGVEIPEQLVLTEMQHHPAPSAEAAREKAALALALRELLRERADALEIDPALDEEERIAATLEHEVSVPEADEETCRRWYDKNRERFRTADLYEASHILFLAPADDPDARAAAKARAEDALAVLQHHPDRFGELARELSACPSREVDGSLGQVSRGQTAPELETFFASLEPGQIAPVPVPSRFGYHVVQLHRRIEGGELPFEAVQDRIAMFLRDRAWMRGVHQYLRLLAGEADIEGVELEGATSPLVQ